MKIDFDKIEDKIEPLDYIRYIGVYILYKNEEIIYVGVSNDVYNRLSQHRIRKKSWDKVAYIKETDYYNAILIENYLINKYKPKLNRGINKLMPHQFQHSKDSIYKVENYPRGWKI